MQLDALPPVGVVQFEQPSGLLVLTMALDPASVGTNDAIGIGRPGPAFGPQIRLDLAVRARRVKGPHPHREER
jgi:hypothetical protein